MNHAVQAVLLKGVPGLRESIPTAVVRMMLDNWEFYLNISGCAAKTEYRLICSNEFVAKQIIHANILDLLPREALHNAPAR